MDFSLLLWATIIGATAVALVVVFRIKGKASPPVPGRFDFDAHKAGELGKRGVFDKTKWR